MRHTSGKLGYFCDKDLIFVTPINDHFVLMHRLRRLLIRTSRSPLAPAAIDRLLPFDHPAASLSFPRCLTAGKYDGYPLFSLQSQGDEATDTIRRTRCSRLIYRATIPTVVSHTCPSDCLTNAPPRAAFR